jgi:hypothetical protein
VIKIQVKVYPGEDIFMLKFVRLTFFAFLALIYGVASAAGYKCTGADGRLSFSDMPCPANTVKDEKIIGRGAGFSHLTDEEQQAFKAAMLARCNGPRNVCECVGSRTADTLTYEEIVQSTKNPKVVSSSIREKAEKAAKYCKDAYSK